MLDEPRELNHLQRYLVEEAAEDYQHGQLTRRQALKMIAGVLGSLAAANSFLAACAPATQPATASPTSAATGGLAATAIQAPTLSPLTPTAPAGSATPPAAAAAATPSAAAPTPAQVAQATRIATQAVITTTATATATAPTRSAPAVASNARVSPDDPAITAGDLQFPGQAVTLLGYLARPNGDGAFPPVLVCHENRGLTDYIKDVVRRLAKAGYAALAVDLLSRQGGIARVTDPSSIPGLLGNLAPDQIVGDFQSGLAHLQGQTHVIKDRPGMIGFCFGGGVTWLCATRIQALRAAVPFYGPNPPLSDVPNIQAAVLAIYGELDQRINAGIPAIEQAMQQNNKVFEKVIEPNANHAFHNDTGANYNPEAAQDAWARALAWFDQHLKA